MGGQGERRSDETHVYRRVAHCAVDAMTPKEIGGHSMGSNQFDRAAWTSPKVQDYSTCP